MDSTPQSEYMLSKICTPLQAETHVKTMLNSGSIKHTSLDETIMHKKKQIFYNQKIIQAHPGVYYQPSPNK